MTKQNILPGFEKLVEAQSEQDFLIEGSANLGAAYFDATDLPDAAGYQDNAENASRVFVLHVVVKDQEQLVRAISALTLGKRKSISKAAHEAVINALAKVNADEGLSYLQLWEQQMAKE